MFLADNLMVVWKSEGGCACGYGDLRYKMYMAGLSSALLGRCNIPKEHLEMTDAAFLQVAKAKADIV